jgi:hypothetical protein
MPCPRPINRQLLRSAGVAWTNRGNQASGTDRLRPSLSLTVSVSSVTTTVSAVGTAISTAEVFIPRLSKVVLMLGHEFMDATDFWTRKATAFLQSDRIKPKLCDLVLPFDVHMWRFIPITGIKEESIRTNSQNCRHEDMLITKRILARQLPRAEASCYILSNG